MADRPSVKFLPSIEGLEPKQLPSGLTLSVLHHAGGARTIPARSELAQGARLQAQAVKPTTGFLVYRITNPTRFNNVLKPPFQQVLVQNEQPVAGWTYNILSIVVRNGTAQTFHEEDNLKVKLPQQHEATAVLTGNQEWNPGEWIVFYVLTKKYYPLPSQVTSGFTFNLGGARSVAVPGPSGIFQRITYDPVKFPRMLNAIVAFGVGAQGGRGVKFGLPVTNIYEFVSAKTNRIDFGGYF